MSGYISLNGMKHMDAYALLHGGHPPDSPRLLSVRDCVVREATVYVSGEMCLLGYFSPKPGAPDALDRANVTLLLCEAQECLLQRLLAAGIRTDDLRWQVP